MNNSGEVVLPCSVLDETLSFFIEKIGFQLESIFPADDPREAVITGFGLRLRLKKNGSGAIGVIHLYRDNTETISDNEVVLVAPNGTQIKMLKSDPSIVIPNGNQLLTISRLNEKSVWKTGRAGMEYRDLIPDRQGERFIGSHIRVLSAGPVPDYVHYHNVRFQMIYCYKGWAKVVYEDQGPPFLFNSGDCVLQPSGMRHRVLENSTGFEVIEISCPAEHLTLVDHDLKLPTKTIRKDRVFKGQRFTHHKAKGAPWSSWRTNDFECRDTGISIATDGLASVKVIRLRTVDIQISFNHSVELHFIFVLSGLMKISCEGHQSYSMSTGDSIVIPSKMGHSLSECSNDLEFLEVIFPSK